MAWYDVGTVSVTNGSTTVTGAGTDFISGVQVGEGLYIGGDLYEIGVVNSSTQLTLSDAYLGSTATGQAYKIIPTQSLVADLSSGVADLISDFADVRDYAGNGKFNDGTQASPAITFTQDQNNGLYRIGSDNWGMSAGGQKQVDISTTDVELNYSGSKKLATTSTGVDVTGTLTADGLTVDGNIQITSNGTPTVDASLTGLQISRNSYPQIVLDAQGELNGEKLLGIANDERGMLFRRFDDAFTTSAYLAKFSATGDVSFYEDTGTTAKMVWSSSAESLGIGTASPSLSSFTASATGLHLKGAAPALRLEDTSGENTYIAQLNENLYIVNQATNGVIRLSTNNTERMRIDSAGNVGIGTASPSGKLDVNTGSSAAYFTRTAGDNGVSAAAFTIGTTATSTRLGNSGDLTFKVGSVGTAANLQPERARIDSSGNLLVGTTNSTLYSAASGGGILLDPNGPTTIARESINGNLILNKTGDNNGALIVLSKDGTNIGNIGVNGTQPYFVDPSNGGVAIDTGGDLIPASATGAPSSNTVDLGTSTSRFKDLYLSGGVYLGGTGAINKLDDYETGTFTPSIEGSSTAGAFTYSTRKGSYTKVGDIVHYEISIYVTNTTTSALGDVKVIGLPFGKFSDGGFASASIGWTQYITFDGQLSAYFGAGTAITLRELLSGGSGSNLSGGSLGNSFYIFISGTYKSA